jgi:hypothetical protein
MPGSAPYGALPGISEKEENPMSRLDSFIRRMTAQRDCLNWAARAIAEIPGFVLELGLGNGRTYDHLREVLPDRNILVFEREVRAHAISLPPPEFLIQGDVCDTLRIAAEKWRGQTALTHMDLGTTDKAANRLLADRISPLLPPLLTTGGIVVSNIALLETTLDSLPCPEGVKPGRYFLYRKKPMPTFGP